MEIVALVNQKGGVAKSTSTYNLAYLKAKAGKSVLMVDFDPQRSLTILCGMVSEKLEYTISDVMQGHDPFDCGYHVEKSGLENLYIIPSSIEFAEVESEMSKQQSRERLLKKQLMKFDGEFDYIFIDCPPQLGILTTNALVAATQVIIPTKAEYLCYQGVRDLKRTIQTVREKFNPDLQLKGVMVTMYERKINDQNDMVDLFRREGTVVGIVKKSADVYRHILSGKPVVAALPKSEPARSYIKIAKII